MNTNSINQATRAVALINFHGMTMVVVEHEGVEYVHLKPISDLAGTDWRTTKRTVLESENAALYGSKELEHPNFAAESGASPTPKTSIYIRLDRARMYLARINIRHMKSQGNLEAAEKLLALQVEWAEALHSYETHCVAYKKAKGDGMARLVNLFKVRTITRNPQEQQALTHLIHEQFAELGQPIATEPDLFSN